MDICRAPAIEGLGSVMVCVDSGISGDVELALTATLSASEGKASEYKLHFVLSCKYICVMYVV